MSGMPWCDCAEYGHQHAPGYVHQWRCAECGYECDSSWLLCPECSSPDDWQQARARVAEGLDRGEGSMRLVVKGS